MTTYTSIASGVQVLPAFPSYCQIDLVADITLSWATDFQNQNRTVCNIMDVTPNAPLLTITLPDAKNASPGQAFKMNNLGADVFTVRKNGGGFLCFAAPATITEIYLTDNTTSAGVWMCSIPPAGTSVTSLNAAPAAGITAANLTITGTPVLPIINAGTLNFSLAGDLLALSSFGNAPGQGIPARTGVGTWELRKLAGTNNQIVVVDDFGIIADPTFSLANDIKGVTSIELLAFLSSPAMQSGFLTLGEPLSSVLPIVPETGELLFYNAASDFAVSLSAPLVAPGNYRLYFPVSLPNTPVYAGSATIPLVSDSTGNLSFDSGGMLRKVVTLSQADVHNLSVAQVELVPAPGVGYVIVPHKFCMNVHFAIAPYANGGDVFIKYSNSDSLIGTIDKQSVTQSESRFSYNSLSTDPDGVVLAQVENNSISIENLVPAFTGGSAGSTIKVTIWYSVIPI